MPFPLDDPCGCNPSEGCLCPAIIPPHRVALRKAGSEQHPPRDNSRTLEVYRPHTVFVATDGTEVSVPGDAYALFAGEEVAKALSAALCALLDYPGGLPRVFVEAHKPVLGLVRDALSASILGRKCAEGTL